MSKKTKSAERGSAQPAPGYIAGDEADDNFFYGDDEDQRLSSSGSGEDTASYIADMVASLAMLAREAKLDLLNYLLDMAHVEAELQARRGETPEDGA
jgi:hypothetical protein